MTSMAVKTIINTTAIPLSLLIVCYIIGFDKISLEELIFVEKGKQGYATGKKKKEERTKKLRF